MNPSLRTLLATLLATLAPLTASASVVDGSWQTTEGQLTLTTAGSAVTGRYTNDNGEIVATLSGNVLSGYWIEDNSNTRCPTARNGRYHWGRIRWEFSADAFAGIWSYCDAEPVAANKWSGTRIAGSPPSAPTADPVLYQNWNRDRCGHTDRAFFELGAAAWVTRVVAWVQWAGSESEIGFTLHSAGKVAAQGTMQRGTCDPYQKDWCEAVADTTVDLGRGFHFVEVARVKQCQNEGSRLNGFIRVHGRTR